MNTLIITIGFIFFFLSVGLPIIIVIYQILRALNK